MGTESNKEESAQGMCGTVTRILSPPGWRFSSGNRSAYKRCPGRYFGCQGIRTAHAATRFHMLKNPLIARRAVLVPE
jgi:hypothetical protein